MTSPSAYELAAELAAAQLADGLVVRLELSPLQAFSLIANLQLAVRHPENVGTPAEIAREVAAVITEQLAPNRPNLAAAIEAGWDPSSDLSALGRFP